MHGLKRLCSADVIQIANKQNASNIMLRGWSFAASVHSDFQSLQKRNRRITIEERSKLVEDFVEKYKSVNAGKFPSTSLTKKQVGGSYYTVKYLIQRLQYKSKLLVVKESIKEPVISSNYNHHEKKSATLVDTKDTSDQISDVGSNSTRVNFLENHESLLNEEPICRALSDNYRDSQGRSNIGTTSSGSITSEKVRSSEASDINDVSSDSVGMSHPEHAHSASMENACKKLPAESKESIVLVEEQQTEIVEKLQQGYRHDVSKPENDRDKIKETAEPLHKKPSVWSNLKSFADGVIKFWKNL